MCIGSVIYEDKEAIIRADKIELNLDTKLGIIYNGNILFKSQNYHVTGEKIERLGEDTYHLDKALITTCDACPPEWNFTGKDVSIKLEDRIKARDVAFYIKGVPVLYSPYFWAPITKERQTGFLFPLLGHSNTKGFRIKEGFFWAIADNRDLTLYLDYYSKRGVGEALQYRYLESPETNGELFVYHMRDSHLNKNFLEVKALHNQELPYDASGYLNLQMVNESDFYKEYSLNLEERLGKYLESNLHISRPFSGGRVYFLGQYRQSLEGSSGEIPQSLPELGFVLNTTRLGPGFFNLNITGNNFWRDEGQRGQRLDINPNFYATFGIQRTITFSQRIGLRETLYALKEPDTSPNRNLFESQSILSTKLFKRYTPFLHIIEPSIEYSYIPSADQKHRPGFDSKDLISKTSLVSYSLTNRFAGKEREALIRFSNGYSLLDVDRPFTPVSAEAAFMSNNLQLKINAAYDI
ncbi:MAG: LPS-assembly protein LptD [Nitrospirae bacterium]|nr:LPS-assembly protein LptD [Nitrospirota bacterium]